MLFKTYSSSGNNELELGLLKPTSIINTKTRYTKLQIKETMASILYCPLKEKWTSMTNCTALVDIS